MSTNNSLGCCTNIKKHWVLSNTTHLDQLQDVYINLHLEVSPGLVLVRLQCIQENLIVLQNRIMLENGSISTKNIATDKNLKISPSEVAEGALPGLVQSYYTLWGDLLGVVYDLTDHHGNKGLMVCVNYFEKNVQVPYPLFTVTG